LATRSPAQLRPGATYVGGAIGALGLTMLLAVNLSRNPPSLALAVGGSIASLVVLALALARYEWAVGLGLTLLAVVKFEPAPTDLVFLIVIAISLATGRFRIDRVPALIAVLLGGYLTLTLLGFSAVVDSSKAFRFSFTTVYLVLFALWLASWTTTRARATIVARTYVFAAVLSAVLGVLAVVAPIPGKTTFLEYGHTRAVGLFKDPNVFGAFLVPAALIVIDEALSRKLLKGRRVTKLAMFLVLALGVVFSFSRAAWVSLALGIAAMIMIHAMRRGGGRRAFALLAIVAVAGGAVAVAVAASGSVSFLQQRAQVQSYDSERFGAQQAGLKLVAQYPFGVGPGQFELYTGISAHSMYIRALAELGILGIVVVLALMLGTLLLALKNAVLARETYGIGSAPLLGAWIGLIVSGFVVDTLHWRHLWLVAALIWAGSLRQPVVQRR
jgi:O-antigen ligase